MMFKIENARIFAETISIISELVTEANIKVNKDGLSIVAIDPANVALVMLNMPKSNFSQFECEKEELLGINLGDMKQVLRRASSSMIMKSEENLLKIEMYDISKKIFSLSLIDVEKEEKKFPSLEFKSKVELNSEVFSEAIGDVAVVADASSFITKDNAFVIEAKGLNRARIEFSGDEAKIEGNARAKYSLEYLQKFIKACKLSEKVLISFSSDYPLRLDFKGSMDLAFILAPRVEEE